MCTLRRRWREQAGAAQEPPGSAPGSGCGNLQLLQAEGESKWEMQEGFRSHLHYRLFLDCLLFTGKLQKNLTQYSSETNSLNRKYVRCQQNFTGCDRELLLDFF